MSSKVKTSLDKILLSQAREWEKIFAKHISNKGLTSWIMNSQNSLIRKIFFLKMGKRDRQNRWRGLIGVHASYKINKSQGCNVHTRNIVSNILTTLYGDGW